MKFLKKYLLDILVVIAFAIISFVYFMPVHVGARRRCPRETPDSARSASSRAVCNAETRYRPSRNDRKKTAASKIKRIRTHRLPVFSGFISLLQTKALFFIPYHPLRLPVKQKAPDFIRNC